MIFWVILWSSCVLFIHLLIVPVLALEFVEVLNTFSCSFIIMKERGLEITTALCFTVRKENWA